jgi:hypothetical protein
LFWIDKNSFHKGFGVLLLVLVLLNFLFAKSRLSRLIKIPSIYTQMASVFLNGVYADYSPTLGELSHV